MGELDVNAIRMEYLVLLWHRFEYCPQHCRLVAKLQPFAGMRHLDVAGGTGDVAFRVLRAIRAAEAETARSSSTAPQACVMQGPLWTSGWTQG